MATGFNHPLPDRLARPIPRNGAPTTAAAGRAQSSPARQDRRPGPAVSPRRGVLENLLAAKPPRSVFSSFLPSTHPSIPYSNMQSRPLFPSYNPGRPPVLRPGPRPLPCRPPGGKMSKNPRPRRAALKTVRTRPSGPDARAGKNARPLNLAGRRLRPPGGCLQRAPPGVQWVIFWSADACAKHGVPSAVAALSRAFRASARSS
jgi:hypothetical protein